MFRMARYVEKKSYTRSRLSASEYQPEYVWCVSNELGTVITRRNGKVVIVGNCQQFGRGLRPLDGKTHGILIDHVGNTIRHGLPDAPRVWTLDRRERRSRGAPDDVTPVHACPKCTGIYERVLPACPYCNHVPTPATRSSPEAVDGDLMELDAATLARLRGEIDKPLVVPYGASPEIVGAVKKRHRERGEAQDALRAVMATWGGWRTGAGDSVRVQQRRFFHTFGVDVLSAMALNRADADALTTRVTKVLTDASIIHDNGNYDTQHMGKTKQYPRVCGSRAAHAAHWRARCSAG